MAVYRNVSTTFWTDSKVSEFTPEEKYFYLFALTNAHTNLSGCYEITIRQMANETGYNEETILKLLDRFEKIHKILFYNKQNNELLIVNWFKYNWTSSQKLDKPLKNFIDDIKTPDFKRFLGEKYSKRDTVSIPYTYPMDTTVSVTVSDTDTEIIKKYEEEIGLLTPNNLTILESYKDDFSKEMIIKAIEIASEQNKKSMAYIKGILNGWKNRNIKTVGDIQNDKKKTKIQSQGFNSIPDDLEDLFDN